MTCFVFLCKCLYLHVFYFLIDLIICSFTDVADICPLWLLTLRLGSYLVVVAIPHEHEPGVLVGVTILGFFLLSSFQFSMSRSLLSLREGNSWMGIDVQRILQDSNYLWDTLVGQILHFVGLLLVRIFCSPPAVGGTGPCCPNRSAWTT